MCNKTVTVVAGDTCEKIWQKHKLNEKSFHRLNPLVECDDLDIGQRICVQSVIELVSKSVICDNPLL